MSIDGTSEETEAGDAMTDGGGRSRTGKRRISPALKPKPTAARVYPAAATVRVCVRVEVRPKYGIVTVIDLPWNTRWGSSLLGAINHSS